MADPLPIPPRWLECPRRGNCVANRFLPFKTPLDSKYDGQVPPAKRFTMEMLFGFASSLKVRIGLIIDLTNTDRFYDKSIVEQMGVGYVKIQCRGHGSTPNAEQTRAFIKVSENYFSQNPSTSTQLNIIGVHCTHGFNRTGFLISAYMIEVENWCLSDAILQFEQARSPGIYKQDYLDELMTKYGEGEELQFTAPALPDWCLEEADGPDEPAEKKRRVTNSNVVQTKPFQPGISGVVCVSDASEVARVQDKMNSMCGWTKRGFPGGQPVSMDKDNILFLQQKPYKVSWKADGSRYLMLLDGDNGVFLADRDYCIFRTEKLLFPHRKRPSTHISETLCDGELVVDEVNGKKVPRFLIYDIIMFNSEPVGQMNFDIRLHCIKKELIDPRNEQREAMEKLQPPFSVRRKDFFELGQCEKLLSPEFEKCVAHHMDGLIFQPRNDPYVPGRCDSQLKWKPHEENSVDFRLRLQQKVAQRGCLASTKAQLYCIDRGQDMLMGDMKVTSDIKPMDGHIIECCWDYTVNSWKFMRERTDKSYPNAVSTYQGVIKSIKYPITKQILLDCMKKLTDGLAAQQRAASMPPPTGPPRRT